jgi:Domain of unknown function (DUF6268)
MLIHIKIKFIAILLCITNFAFSQNNSLSQLFYPNITLNSKKYTSAAPVMGNGINYELGRGSISGFVPIRSEVQVGIGFRKKFDLKAVHTVLAINLAENTTSRKPIDYTSAYKTVALSVIQMQASLRERLWVYGGGIGFSESNETFFAPQPYFWGGASRMRVLGLNTQILYGSILVFNQKFRIIPVFGFNKKIGDNWRISGMAPFQASASRKFSDWFNLEAGVSLKGYSAGYQVDNGTEKLKRKENYHHVNLSIAANAHILKVFNFSIEGGIAGARTLRTYNLTNERLAEINPKIGPYFGASVRYITTKSKFSSKFLNKVGIGL